MLFRKFTAQTKKIVDSNFFFLNQNHRIYNFFKDFINLHKNFSMKQMCLIFFFSEISLPKLNCSAFIDAYTIYYIFILIISKIFNRDNLV